MREEVVEESLGDRRELEELGKAAYGLHSGEKVSDKVKFRGGSRGRVCTPPPRLPADLYFYMSQLRHSLVVHPLLRKILDVHPLLE